MERVNHIILQVVPQDESTVATRDFNIDMYFISRPPYTLYLFEQSCHHSENWGKSTHANLRKYTVSPEPPLSDFTQMQ